MLSKIWLQEVDQVVCGIPTVQLTMEIMGLSHICEPNINSLLTNGWQDYHHLMT
jgi:hypothetical protein